MGVESRRYPGPASCPLTCQKGHNGKSVTSTFLRCGKIHDVVETIPILAGTAVTKARVFYGSIEINPLSAFDRLVLSSPDREAIGSIRGQREAVHLRQLPIPSWPAVLVVGRYSIGPLLHRRRWNPMRGLFARSLAVVTAMTSQVPRRSDDCLDSVACCRYCG